MKARVAGRRGPRGIAALFVFALVATACVQSGDTESSERAQPGTEVEARVPKEPTEPVTVRFASWVGESPQMKKFQEEFQQQHPNITIKFENVPAERARDKLITQVAGGNAPDVAFMDSGSVEDFSSRGALVNLDG